MENRAWCDFCQDNVSTYSYLELKLKQKTFCKNCGAEIKNIRLGEDKKDESRAIVSNQVTLATDTL